MLDSQLSIKGSNNPSEYRQRLSWAKRRSDFLATESWFEEATKTATF